MGCLSVPWAPQRSLDEFSVSLQRTRRSLMTLHSKAVMCARRLCFLLCLLVFVFFKVAPIAAYFSLSLELSWVTFSVSPCCIVKMSLSYLKWSEGLLANYSTFIAREICSWNGQTLTIVPGWFSLYLFPVFFLGSPLVSAQSSPVGSQKEEGLVSFITSRLISIG